MVRSLGVLVFRVNIVNVSSGTILPSPLKVKTILGLCHCCLNLG